MFKFAVSRLTREPKRLLINAWLIARHRGLIIASGATVRRSKLGRYNLICERANLICSELGDYSYIGGDSFVGNTCIGKFCSIGPKVMIGLGMHPTRGFVSTHPIFYSTTFPSKNTFATEQGFVEQGRVTIGHDVWIGASAIIADNIKIGTGAIVGAGAVVVENIEPYSVVGGVPAKLLRKRFSDNEIEELLESEWWHVDEQILASNFRSFRSLQSFRDFYRKACVE